MFLKIKVNIGHHSAYIQQLNVTCLYSNLYCTILMWWYHNHRSHTCPPDPGVNVQFRFKYFRSQDQVTTLVWHTTCNLGHMYVAIQCMIMYILALWVPVAGTYGCLKGLGFGRLEGRWKGRGHTRVPLGEGTFGARLGPACIQGHLLNQLHLLPFPSPPRQQCNKSFTYLFEPLVLMCALSQKLGTLVLYSKCASVPGTQVIWYHYPITLSTIFSQNLVCLSRQNKYAEQSTNAGRFLVSGPQRWIWHY